MDRIYFVIRLATGETAWCGDDYPDNADAICGQLAKVAVEASDWDGEQEPEGVRWFAFATPEARDAALAQLDLPDGWEAEYGEVFKEDFSHCSAYGVDCNSREVVDPGGRYHYHTIPIGRISVTNPHRPTDNHRAIQEALGNA